MYLFVYGSLVSLESASATLGRQVRAGSVPYAATLTGWQRSWNVASGRHSHPERRMFEDDGREFTGVMAVLGISRAAGRVCTGAVYEVDEQDLLRLDARERNYLRVDVTGQMQTYVPKPSSVQRLSEAVEVGDAVVRSQYAALVESSFRGLGEDGPAGFGRTTIASDLERRPLRFEWPA